MAPTYSPCRRALLRAGAAAAVSALVGAGATGCAAPLAGTRLRLGTGGSQGVYYALGRALADGWTTRLELTEAPVVRTTAGSVENLALLAAGDVDVIFSAADVADSAAERAGTLGTAPRALARVYDDALQVVVPADSGLNQVADLRGRRVSIGATDSGVIVMATRLLSVAGLSADRDLTASTLGIDESAAALREGRIDAFFWSGGVPTGGVAALAATRRIRLLDLTALLTALRGGYPVYDVGTVPAGTYGVPDPVTTMFVRNFLLVRASMPDELAAALVDGLFAERDRLVRASAAGRVIDTRSAIGTQPVPLHPGAERWYRSAKDYD